MEAKIKKLFIISGVALGAAAAFIPLTSYAAETAGTTAVSVNVQDRISLDSLSAGSEAIAVDPQTIGTGQLSAKVTSTRAYTISLRADNPNLVRSGGSDTIAASADVRAGNTAWGIKKSGATSYTALTTGSNIFYTSTAGTNNASVQTNFEIGVSVAPGTTTGTYSTEIEVLAAVVTK